MPCLMWAGRSVVGDDMTRTQYTYERSDGNDVRTFSSEEEAWAYAESSLGDQELKFQDAPGGIVNVLDVDGDTIAVIRCEFVKGGAK